MYIVLSLVDCQGSVVVCLVVDSGLDVVVISGLLVDCVGWLVSAMDDFGVDVCGKGLTGGALPTLRAFAGGLFF